MISPAYRRITALLIAAASLLALFYAVTELPQQLRQDDFQLPDVAGYRTASQLLYHEGLPHYARPFGFSLLYGIPYLVGNPDASQLTAWAVALNMTFWLLTVALLYVQTAAFVAPRAALALALIFALNVGNLAMTAQGLTETFYTFLLLLCYRGLYLAQTRQSLYYQAIAFFIFAYTCLVRPSLYPFLPLFLLFLLFAYRKKKATASLAAKRFFIGIIVCAVGLIGLQLAAMKRHFGNYTLSYIDAVTYYAYLGAHSEACHTGKNGADVYSERLRELHDKPNPDRKRIARNDFFRQVSQHPRCLAAVWAQHLDENSRDGNAVLSLLRQRTQQPAAAGWLRVFFEGSRVQNRLYSTIGLYGLPLLGLWAAVRRRRRGAPLFGGGMPVYVLFAQLTVVWLLLTAAVSSWQGDRFHLVIVPLVLANLAFFWGRLPQGGYRRKVSSEGGF